jgi:hypothetical protein
MKIGRKRRCSTPDSLIWRLDLLVSVGMAGGLSVCIGLGVLSSSTWIAILATGGGLLTIVGIALYVVVRPFFVALEDKLRGRGAHKFDVFISYRHRQHSEIVDRIHNSLTARGLSVWLDKNGGVQPGSWGLLLPLLRGLRYSRSVIFLVPQQGQAIDAYVKPNIIKEKIKQLCVQPIELAIAFWHRACYDVELLKRPSESWQQWESRVALETQVPMFFTVTIDAGNIIGSDLERVVSTIPAARTQHLTILLRPEQVGEDIAKPLKQSLRVASRVEREIPISENGVRKFRVLFGVIVAVIALLGLSMVLSEIVTKIKEALAWPFVQLSNLAQKAKSVLARGKISRS